MRILNNHGHEREREAPDLSERGPGRPAGTDSAQDSLHKVNSVGASAEASSRSPKRTKFSAYADDTGGVFDEARSTGEF